MLYEIFGREKNTFRKIDGEREREREREREEWKTITFPNLQNKEWVTSFARFDVSKVHPTAQ
jgi:hypothetical protein